MSRHVLKNNRFYEDEDVYPEEDGKCPPQQAPWSNLNDDWASRTDEESVPVEESVVSFEEKDQINVENQQSFVVAKEGIGPSRRTDVNCPDAEALGTGADHPTEGRRSQIPNRIEDQYTSGGQAMVSPLRRTHVSPGVEAVGTGGNHPTEGRHSQIPDRIFPGAYREGGGTDNEEGYVVEDEFTIWSPTEPPLPRPLEAELVNTEEEERRHQDHINRALQRERRLVQDQIDQALQREHQKSVKRWTFVGAFLLIVLIVVGVILGITLRPESDTDSTEKALDDLLSSVSSDGGTALRNSSTPQNKAFNWLVASNTDLGTYTNETIIQRYALATLYFSTNGVSWKNNTFWLSNEDACGTTPWYGINCKDTGSVLDLSLPENNLNGTLPLEIVLLSSLQSLWLPSNALEGVIPTEIGQLTYLTGLSLYDSSLSGRIPSEIGLLSSLESLDLSWNELVGSLPTEIGQLTQLTGLYLNSNPFSGTIPSEIGLISGLAELDLGGDNLTGTILPITALTNLERLWLCCQALDGSLPTEIGQLTQLKNLHLVGNALSGSLPTEVGQLTELAGLYLYDNEFSGTIPSEIGLISGLAELDLDGNNLTGTILPITALTNLERLWLCCQELDGSLPTEIGQLTQLTELWLGFNALNGIMPTEVGQLTELGILALDNNWLSGTIPSEAINSLTKLEILYLHTNMFTGNYTCPDFIDGCYISCDDYDNPACRSLG